MRLRISLLAEASRQQHVNPASLLTQPLVQDLDECIDCGAIDYVTFGGPCDLTRNIPVRCIFTIVWTPWDVRVHFEVTRILLGSMWRKDMGVNIEEGGEG